MKAFSTVAATVLLLVITIAVVGASYGFIGGLVQTITPSEEELPGLIEELLGGGVCGDGTCNTGESCDTCFQDCDLPGGACCGDNTQQGTEECDGTDLNGMTCADIPPYDGGTLQCSLPGPSECTFDTTLCTQCGDGMCEGGEDGFNCPADCAEMIGNCGIELNIANTVYILTVDITGYSGTCFTITADNITLDGNGHIVDGDDVGTDYGVSATTGQVSLTIKNLTITDFSKGINFAGTNDSIIQNNTVTSNSDGIYLSSSSNNIIQNNTIKLNSVGINLFPNSNNTQVINNIVNSNSNGILIASSHNHIINNIITSSTSSGISLQFNSNNTIMNNIVNSNAAIGLAIVSSSYNTIIDNTVNLNFIGIFLQTSSNNMIQDSVISSNSYGVYLTSNSNNNILLNDNIAGNSNNEILDNTGNTNVNYLIYNNSFGEIKWIDDSDGGFLKDLDVAGDLTFPGNITLFDNFAFLNTSVFSPGINSSANITLIAIPDFFEPVILKDGVPCGNACYNFTPLVGDVLFNVTDWTMYSIGELL